VTDLFFEYHRIHPVTWAFLSTLLMLALFFKFNRLWSVRNLDLVLLALLAPGLLMVSAGRETTLLCEQRLREAGLPIETPGSDRNESQQPPVRPAPPAAAPGGDPTDPSFHPARVPSATISDEPEQLVLETMLGEAAGVACRKQLAVAESLEKRGYIWLFVVGGLWLVRLMLDPTMVRRPLLAPNLSVGGMSLLGCALLVMLMANVIVSEPSRHDLAGPRGAQELLEPQDGGPKGAPSPHGPGYYLLHVLPSLPTVSLVDADETIDPTERRHTGQVAAAKVMAILSHLGILLGLVFVTHWHFGDYRVGVAAATLYLMLPYTALMTGSVEHALPAALMVWAVALYRRPLLAGLFLGLSFGSVYYPIYVAPLWISFYWERGMWRFLAGVASALAIMILVLFGLLLATGAGHEFGGRLREMFGVWLPAGEGLHGFWQHVDGNYRLPVLAAFFVLCGAMTLWPPQKNLGTLISLTAAIMLASQFWQGYGDGGGSYMAWYLPPLLLTIFRPNLEDRVAQVVLSKGWLGRRRESALEQAA